MPRRPLSTYQWSRPPQKRLKLYLLEHDITQTWLAEQVGLALPTLSGILSGRERLTPRVRGLIAKALDQPSGSLFVGVEDPTDDELAEATEAELWKTMPPIDDETIDRLRRLLFPQHARETAEKS